MNKSMLLAGAMTTCCVIAPPVPAHAEDDPAAAIAELRAENARLAAKIDALEAALEERGGDASPAPNAAPGPIASAVQGSVPGERVEGAMAEPPVITVTPPPAPAERPVQGGGIGLQLNGSNGGGQVAISVGQSLRTTRVAPDQVKASATTWSLVASSPVAKSGDTSIGSLDSFTDASSLRFRVGRLFVSMPNLLRTDRYLAFIDKATHACEAAAKDQAGRRACQETDVDEAFIRKWAPEGIPEYVRLTSTRFLAWGYGAEGTVGYRKFRFIEAPGTSEASSEKVPWGARLYGTVLPSPDLAVVASIAYQQGFEEQKTRTICPTGTPGSNVICAVGPNGRPDSVEKVLLALEGRKLFDLSQGPFQNGIVDRFGIAPQVAYDANNDDFGIDVPVYLTADDKGNLIGGIRFGYETGESGFNAGVFVGSSFDLSKR